ncbi:MAG: hypothetical protein ACREDO_10000 [Methyloceanibacter sp.]
MTEPPSPRVAILDREWPGRPLSLAPGDLTEILPQGLALDVPLMVTSCGSGPDRGLYGVDATATDPFHAAPPQKPCGGTLYFDDNVDFAQLASALAVIGVHLPRKDYAVFGAVAEAPVSQRFLEQVRIVSKGALAHFFQTGGEAEALPEQPLTLGAFVESFIVGQRATFNDPQYAFSSRLSDTLGGDGDSAKEPLAFGFFVENT